jgi:hypothetical protein
VHCTMPADETISLLTSDVHNTKEGLSGTGHLAQTVMSVLQPGKAQRKIA